MYLNDYEEWVDAREEARQDEEGAEYGDPRRCPRHPGVRTSSNDGMFDGVCGQCEGECAEYAEEAAEREAYAASGSSVSFEDWRAAEIAGYQAARLWLERERRAEALADPCPF